MIFVCLVGDLVSFTDSTIVNHHLSPSFGKYFFFSKHRISKSKQIIFEEQLELHLSSDQKIPGCISILDRGLYYTTQEYGVYIRIPVPDEGSLYLTLFFLANTIKTVGFSMAMSVYRSDPFFFGGEWKGDHFPF